MMAGFKYQPLRIANAGYSQRYGSDFVHGPKLKPPATAVSRAIISGSAKASYSGN